MTIKDIKLYKPMVLMQSGIPLIHLNCILAPIVFLLLFMLIPDFVSCQPNSSTGSTPEQVVDSIISEWISPDEPGLAITIYHGDSTILTKGYGMANLEHSIPITASTVFNLGSVSKQFTAFAVALLVDEGLISLDADVRTYLPELSIREKVSIRQLLDHTSGFRDEAGLLSLAGYWMEDAVSQDQVLRMLSRQKELMFAPGSKWQYSNSGYTLLAEVITRVTGVPFAAWMQSNMFDPLGLTDTRFLSDRTKVIQNMADSYDIGADNTFIQTLLSYSNAGPTNLITNARDMAKWAENLIRQTVGGEQVFQMYDIPGILISGDTTDYAFGQFVETHKGLHRLFHSGTIGNFNCGLVRYPDQQFVVVILSNFSVIRPLTIAGQIAEVFLQDDFTASETSAKPSRNDKNNTSNPQPKSFPLSTYVGKYRLAATGKILEVTIENDQLFLVNISDTPLQLSSLKTGSFALAGVGAKVTFDFNENDEAATMVLHFGATPLEAARVHILDFAADELMEFSGLYYSDELMVIYKMTVDSGNLVARHCRYPDDILTPIDTLAFTGSGRWLRDVRFEMDKTGRIKGFRAGSGRVRNIFFKKLE